MITGLWLIQHLPYKGVAWEILASVLKMVYVPGTGTQAVPFIATLAQPCCPNPLKREQLEPCLLLYIFIYIMLCVYIIFIYVRTL